MRLYYLLYDFSHRTVKSPAMSFNYSSSHTPSFHEPTAAHVVLFCSDLCEVCCSTQNNFPIVCIYPVVFVKL